MNKNKGLTLVEVLVAMSITTIILSIITAVFMMGMKTFRSEQAKSNLQTESRTRIDRISDDTRLGTTVNSTLTDPQTMELYTSGPKVLILKVLAIDNNNNVLYDKYDYFVYKIDALERKIIKRTLPHVDSARQIKTEDFLFNKVNQNSGFTYSPESPPSPNINSVNINLITDQMVDGKNYSYTINSSSNLRNK